LSVTVPHATPAHVVLVGLGVQHAPFLHSPPAAHVPHDSGCPQLSVTVPQAAPAHDAVTFGAQHELPLHSSPVAVQVSGHVTMSPQLFFT
jgi:hypothetical protein